MMDDVLLSQRSPTPLLAKLKSDTSSRISSSRITFFLFLSFPPKGLNHRSEMEQILLWIRLIYPWLFLKRKTGWGSWGRWELPFGTCLCWHLWSVQARGYGCEVEMPNQQGQRRAIPGAEQRMHHSTEANPAQPRHSACTQPALEKQGMLGWQFEKILSLRGDALQQVFVQSLQTDTVLQHTPVRQDSGMTNQRAAITEIIHPI